MKARSSRIVFALALLTVVMLASATPALAAARWQSTPEAGTPVPTRSFEVTGNVLNPGAWTVADLEQFPVQTVEVTYISGEASEDHTFTGVLLADVLAAVELDADPDGPKNAILRYYLVFTAKDGYQVLLSGGEFDPGFGNHPVLLAWEQDGEPLTAEDGPVRLVVPGDVRGGRYISGIATITVATIDDPAP
ncbi:MAG: molybdopterin-dependent oxidoreductase [Chloroflexota bacterium]|nr:molybdopterin-dependent oxidoreductase [Chloroflexota bacterium]